jgi:hypothetical protein
MSTYRKTFLLCSLITVFLLYLSIPFVYGATTPPPKPTVADYYPLVGIPGITNLGTSTSLPSYINAVYILVISIGALIGVVKIAIAGVKYSMSDIITDKGEAKKDIMGVLLGLAILLIPFIVLNTIYPGLTNLNVLSGVKKVDLLSPSNGTSPTTAVNTQTKGCTYDPVFAPDCASAVGSEMTCQTPVSYDRSKCISDCVSLNGAFKPINQTRSECSYTPQPQAPASVENPNTSNLVSP